MTATPYERLGDLPLPRLHIPTWFGITSPSENNDALLDLNLLVNENNNPMYTIDNNIIPVEEDEEDYFLDMGGTHVEDHIGYRLSSNFEEEYTTYITLNDSHTYQIWHTLEYNDTGVTYVIYAINKELGFSKQYHYSWNKVITGYKISSVARLVESFWKTYLKDLLDATEDVAQYSYAIQTGCPSIPEFLLNQVKNSDYLIGGNEDSRLDPIQIIEVSCSKDQLIIGDVPPREGSIIAYSDNENVLQGTNSLHVLYFEHADLHRFNFTIPHNHVINRIEKLYRHDENNNSIANLDTTVDTPDISSYKLIINSTNDGSIVSGTTKLILIEGGY